VHVSGSADVTLEWFLLMFFDDVRRERLDVVADERRFGAFAFDTSEKEKKLFLRKSYLNNGRV
jgi:hypothetical protein